MGEPTAAPAVPVCGACGQRGDLIWCRFYRLPDGWRCVDVAACYARDWPEKIPPQGKEVA